MCAQCTGSCDWVDVRRYMKLLDKDYKVSTSMMLAPVGRHDGVAFILTLVATWVDLETPEKIGSASAHMYWPNREYASMEATAYHLCFLMEAPLTGARYPGSAINW
jgi:hypothetical protein